MATIRMLEDLVAWKLARRLVWVVYEFTRKPDVKSDFGYCDQIQGAAMSAMSNISEGLERRSDKEFAHFLNLAIASASEVKSMLHAGLDEGYLSKDEFNAMLSLCRDTIRTTSKLQAYLRRSIRSQKPNRP